MACRAEAPMLWGRSRMKNEECKVKNGRQGAEILRSQFCILHFIGSKVLMGARFLNKSFGAVSK
jgi:hypothetical protein